MNRANHILLVDDNEVDNFIAEHLFKVHSAASRITSKTSAVKALEYLQQNMKEPHVFPDYILLDINMPQMDGFAFLKEFEKFPETVKKRCRIIVLTSSENKEDEEKAGRNPYVKKYLHKPLSDYTIEEILD